jgi:tRNA pseudouridine38-40 synthase
MNTYKAIIAYDGTNYFGWQKQRKNQTIVSTLQNSFYDTFHTPIAVFGASRTDAGVHALGQVAACTTPLAIPAEKILRAWNNKLPGDVCIRSLEKVESTFNPHNNVLSKTYHYTFALERPMPFIQRYQWHYNWPVNIKKLQDLLHVFIGEHDFRSFCTGNDHPDTIRTITSITLNQESPTSYTLVFNGPKFLRYMIRRLTGALLECASRTHLHESHLRYILHQKNPLHSLPTAPAKGLTLIAIDYTNNGLKVISNRL